MQLPLSPLVRLPRVLLEHPLPLDGHGVSPSAELAAPDGNLLTITLGGVDRWNRSGGNNLCPGFTLDSLCVFSALLALSERMSGAIITYNQLFRAMGSRSCCSAHHREALKSSLAGLESMDLAIHSRSQGMASFEKLLTLEACHGRPVFGRRAPAFSVAFSPTLLLCLADGKASAPVHLRALCSLRSRTARVLYLILTTWAHYSRAHARHPFRITLSKLIAHLGRPVPCCRSSRRAFFFGHRARSLFDEINHQPTPYGTLHLRLAEASATDDDCVLAWIAEAEEPRQQGDGVTTRRDIEKVKNLPPVQQPAPRPAIPGDPLFSVRHLKLYQAWNASGRADGEFLRRIRETKISLSQEDVAALVGARVAPSSCESFLLMAKKLLPERTWLDLLGEAKYAAATSSPPKSPTGKLISEMLSALKSGL